MSNIKRDDRLAAVTGELDKIARDFLKINTLDTRHRDSLDFHEVAVWSVREALAQAYAAGHRAYEERNATEREISRFNVGTRDKRRCIQILLVSLDLLIVRHWEQNEGEHSPSSGVQFDNARLAFKHAIALAENEIEDIVETVESMRSAKP